jgi:hypothetical protein
LLKNLLIVDDLDSVVDGHQVDDQQVDDHQVDDQQVYDQQVDDQQVDDHQVDDHQVDDHQVDGQQVHDLDSSGDARKDDELIDDRKDANDHEHSNENVSSSLPVRDALYDRLPTVVVSVAYDHPILSQLSDGDFWCGAPPSEEVYENPYNAANYSWEIPIDTWNSFQSRVEQMGPEELVALRKKREDDMERQLSEFDDSYKGRKRMRDF